MSVTYAILRLQDTLKNKKNTITVNTHAHIYVHKHAYIYMYMYSTLIYSLCALVLKITDFTRFSSEFQIANVK